MKIDIDINRIVEEIDVTKLVEESIKQNVEENVDFGNIIDDLINNRQELISKKIVNIIDEYLSSEEGRRYVIDAFNDKISESDILSDDAIIDLVIQLLKKNLKIER